MKKSFARIADRGGIGTSRPALRRPRKGLKRQKIKLLRANLRALFSRDGPSRRAFAYALDDPESYYPPVGTVTQRVFLTGAASLAALCAGLGARAAPVSRGPRKSDAPKPRVAASVDQSSSSSVNPILRLTW